MVKTRARSRPSSSSTFKWKEPLGLVLTYTGLSIGLFAGILAISMASAGKDGVGMALLVTIGALAIFAAGLYLLHLARWRPGWVFEAATFPNAFDGIDDAGLRDVARALSEADEETFDDVVRRATLGRFSRVMEAVPGICQHCARGTRTQRLYLVRALVVPVGVATVYIWEYSSPRLCRECAGSAFRHYLGLGEGGGGAASIAGVLWLPWNAPQYLWSRRLPRPPEREGVPPSVVRALALRAPDLIAKLRAGQQLPELTDDVASELSTSQGNVALFLIAYGELCRRQAPRTGR